MRFFVSCSEQNSGGYIKNLRNFVTDFVPHPGPNLNRMQRYKILFSKLFIRVGHKLEAIGYLRKKTASRYLFWFGRCDFPKFAHQKHCAINKEYIAFRNLVKNGIGWYT